MQKVLWLLRDGWGHLVVLHDLPQPYLALPRFTFVSSRHLASLGHTSDFNICYSLSLVLCPDLAPFIRLRSAFQTLPLEGTSACRLVNARSDGAFVHCLFLLLDPKFHEDRDWACHVLAVSPAPMTSYTEQEPCTLNIWINEWFTVQKELEAMYKRNDKNRPKTW